MDKEKIKQSLVNNWKYILLPIGLVIGFIFGVTIIFEEPSCEAFKKDMVQCPTNVTKYITESCNNNSNTIVRYVERNTNANLLNNSKNCTRSLNDIITIKRLERERDAIFDLNDSTTNQQYRTNLTRCVRNLNESEEKLNDILDLI